MDVYYELLAGFGVEYFGLSQEEEICKADMQKYRTILNSKSNEESLVSTQTPSFRVCLIILSFFFCCFFFLFSSCRHIETTKLYLVTIIRYEIKIIQCCSSK